MIVTCMDDSQVSVLENTDNTSGGNAMMLLKIEEMIKSYLSQINQLQEEITKRKEMFDDTFVNDQTFQEHDKAAKEASRIRSATKQQILKRADVADLFNKLKELKAERKELQQGLSDYLREYQRLSGSNEFEGEDGQMQEIVYIAKLVKKSSKFRP